MNEHRGAIEADIAAFLASGGQIQVCDSSANAGAAAVSRMSRSELIAHRKRLDGNAILIARLRKRGGAE